jgi:thiol-disulfide isomerase/thioredoxin
MIALRPTRRVADRTSPGRRRLPWVLLVLALVAAACGGTSEGSSGDGTAGAGDGSPAASPWSFSAPTLDDGAAFEAASLEGTPTVLWFWAPWCVSCRAEAPEVVAAAGEFADRVTLVGVAGRGEVPAMEGFVADTDTGSLTHVVDADGAIWSQFGVFAQPAYAFIDVDGNVDVFVGSLGTSGLSDRMSDLVDA